MRLFIDEDVLLEYVGDRAEARTVWEKINALQISGYAELWVAASVYRGLFSVMSEASRAVSAAPALEATMGFLDVCPVTEDDVRYALSSGDDYDQAIAASCAERIGVDYIVSRTLSKRKWGRIPVVTPEGLFEALEVDHGVTFDLVEF